MVEKIGVWSVLSERRLTEPIFFHDTPSEKNGRNLILEPFMNQLDAHEIRLLPTGWGNGSHS
jgi:hypothetical protein